MNSHSACRLGVKAFEAWAPDGTCYTRVSIHGHTLGVQLEPNIRHLTGQQVAERLLACNDVAYLKGRVATREAIENDPYLRDLDLDGFESHADLATATLRLSRVTASNPCSTPRTRPVENSGRQARSQWSTILTNPPTHLLCDLDELVKTISTLECTRTDPDCVVVATLGAGGRLSHLWMDQSAPSRFGHLELEAKVNDTMGHALAEVQAAWMATFQSVS